MICPNCKVELEAGLGRMDLVVRDIAASSDNIPSAVCPLCREVRFSGRCVGMFYDAIAEELIRTDKRNPEAFIFLLSTLDKDGISMLALDPELVEGCRPGRTSDPRIDDMTWRRLQAFVTSRIKRGIIERLAQGENPKVDVRFAVHVF